VKHRPPGPHSVTGVYPATGEVMLPDFALHLLGEPLPLLGHFSQERLEPWINRAARFLEASRRESPIFSRVLHIAPPLEMELRSPRCVPRVRRLARHSDQSTSNSSPNPLFPLHFLTPVRTARFRCHFSWSGFAQFFHCSPTVVQIPRPFLGVHRGQPSGLGAGLWRNVPSSSRNRFLLNRFVVANAAATPI
jgi:hypothetical protein